MYTFLLRTINGQESSTTTTYYYQNTKAVETSSYVLEPFVDVKDSVKPDYLVCLEDGKKLKMLKRYLKTKYNMTDKDYREKWGLPNDYPMIAPTYAKKRSSLAKEKGLGKNKG